MPIVNISNSNVLAHKVAVADTPVRRMQGLLGRECLEASEALVITSCQSIHMLFMKFPLDVIFVDKHGMVVGLCEDIQPFCLSPVFFKAAYAIELTSGTISQTQTKIGHTLSFPPIATVV